MVIRPVTSRVELTCRMTFKPVKFDKSVAAGGPHYYTVVGSLSSPELSGERWSTCDGIEIVTGEVVPEKYPPDRLDRELIMARKDR